MTEGSDVFRLAAENIKNHEACAALTQGRYEKFNSFQDAWLGVAEYAKQALSLSDPNRYNNRYNV